MPGSKRRTRLTHASTPRRGSSFLEALEPRRMFIGEDRFEVNDSFALATDLGSVGVVAEDDLTIHDADDADYFRFTTTGPGQLDISVSFIHVLGDVDLVLYDESEQFVADSTTTSNTEQISIPAAAGSTFYAVVVGFQDDTSPDYDLTINGAAGGLPPWLDQASIATWDDPSNTLIVSGEATIIADPAASGDEPAIFASGENVQLDVDPDTDLAVHVAELNLSDGATTTIVSLGGARTAANHRVLVTGSLSIDASSTLNVTDNDVILDYSGASPAAGVEADVAGAYNVGVGDWSGTGITSSVAAGDGNFHVAVADNAALAAPFGSAQGGPNFAGVDVDLDTVLVKFTHRADVDLDGVVTPNDAAIFGGNYSENDFATWSTGDMDYDGLFTPTDAAIFGGFYDESLPAV